jgi:hypothetical protein
MKEFMLLIRTEGDYCDQYGGYWGLKSHLSVGQSIENYFRMHVPSAISHLTYGHKTNFYA